ncbi:MAG: CpaE family protein [Planctomycetota bacterium]
MRFFLVSDDDAAAAVIRSVILDRGLEFPAGNQCRLAGVPGLLRTLSQTPTPAEAQTTIVLVMPENADAGIEAVAAICSGLPCRLLLAGSIADSRVVLRAMRLGAVEYLDLTDLGSELNHALDRIDQRRTRAYTIGVFSAAGGAGCSLVAANLACELARKPGSCALVDLKAEGGDLATLLNLKSAHTLADVSRNVDGLDAAVLKNCLVPHPGGALLLSAGGEFPSFVPVDPRAVQRSLSLLSRQVEFVVLDLDRCLNHVTFTTAQTADVLVLVMRPDFPSLKRTRLMLDWMVDSGVDRAKFRVVLNRTGWSGEVPASQVADGLQMKVSLEIPDDPKPMLRSVNSGEPLVLAVPSAKFSKRMVQLSEELRGLAARRGS